MKRETNRWVGRTPRRFATTGAAAAALLCGAASLAVAQSADPVPAPAPGGDAPLIGSIIDLPTSNEDDIIFIPVSATLRALDKTTARFRDLEVDIDQPVVFGTLEVVVRTCEKKPPEEPPEVTAFVQVADYGLDGVEALKRGRPAEKEQVFSGWMFASSPALNPLEHPVYDVWVIDCKMQAPPE
ncbi:MAG: DUF2155 domain-containing protein [Pseudomonadota bacterium]